MRIGALTKLARLSVLALALLPLSAVAQDDFQRNSERLESVRRQIRQVQAELERERGRQSGLNKELRGLDEKIAGIAGRLHRLGEQEAERRRRIELLQREFAAEQARMADHKDFLTQQLQAAHFAGREEYLKLLLNQQDPARVDRVLVYYDYLNRARGERIRAAAQQLQRLQTVRRTLDEELAGLQTLRTRQEQEQQSLAAVRAERGTALARIQAEIAAKDSALQRLREDEREVARLLDRLRAVLADIPEQPGQRTPFRGSRGKLSWPLEGRVSASFGSPRGLGDVRWSGVLIEAAEGRAVKAVSHGRVVFADWLRGLGLLMIIEHGDGYMTLYGYNEALFKEAGSWVDAGETIATVGASGGRSSPGLYFEVRADGKAVDPVAWLKPRR